MLAYDKHMNFVLAECEEFRTVKVRYGPPQPCSPAITLVTSSLRMLQGKKAKGSNENEAAPTVQQKRTLGLVILRGETIVSVSVEGPPPVAGDEKSSLLAGPGRGVPAGRGMGLGAGELDPMNPASWRYRIRESHLELT